MNKTMLRTTASAAWLGTVMLSAAAGWWLHAPGAAPALQPPVHAQGAAINTGLHAAAAPADKGPLIAVSSDGNVTLRVEQQPLAWVLEQIAQQSGWSDVKARAQPTPAAGPANAAAAVASSATDCAEAATRTAALTAAQTEQLLKTLQSGSEGQRYDGLMQARSAGVAVPEDTLKVLFETDASEAVRLQALETYLEPRSGDSSALRSALQAALYVPNTAVAQEAQRRLDELNESERIDAASQQQAGR